MTTSSTPRPHVSIVLPTFNRSRFLPAAFQAILSQGVKSWELVIVDDGSTDDSRRIVAELSTGVSQPVKYVYQENRGAYGARNTGVEMAAGEYIAFYDSDDLWLPQHLQNCVSALDQFSDVDWVYSASELVDLESGRVLDRNCFYEQGRPRPFMRLRHERRGPLHVITDPGAIRCQIRDGLYCGLQNSVLRRRVFDRLRFAWEMRNEAEDQVFAIRAVAAGFRLAYLDDVHVRYQVHDENSSGSAKNASLQKHVRVYEPLIRGYEQMASEVALNASEQRELKRRLGRELFWHLGYAGYWAAGERRQALAIFSRALRTWPWNASQWKTYLLAVMRTLFNARPGYPLLPGGNTH